MVRTRPLRLVEFSPVDFSAIMPGLFLLPTRGHWEVRWTMANYGQQPMPDLPEVDWMTEVVLFLMLGCRPTTGYQVTIDKVEVRDDELVVHATEERPGGRPTGQKLTAPAHAVAIPAKHARDRLLLIQRIIVG